MHYITLISSHLEFQMFTSNSTEYCSTNHGNAFNMAFKLMKQDHESLNLPYSEC